jgi:hypothetical protein
LCITPVTHFCSVVGVQNFLIRADALHEQVLPAAMKVGTLQAHKEVVPQQNSLLRTLQQGKWLLNAE